MIPEKLKIAVVELTSGEDAGANTDQILNLLADLKGSPGVDLICLPENSIWLRISKSRFPVDLRLDDKNILRLQAYVDQSGAGMMLDRFPFAKRIRFTMRLSFCHRANPEKSFTAKCICLTWTCRVRPRHGNRKTTDMGLSRRSWNGRAGSLASAFVTISGSRNSTFDTPKRKSTRSLFRPHSWCQPGKLTGKFWLGRAPSKANVT